MIYLYRIIKIIFWGFYSLVCIPLTFVLWNIAIFLWYFNFKHFHWISKEEWKDLSRWNSVHIDIRKNEAGEWISYNREYYYSNPKELFLDKKNYL